MLAKKFRLQIQNWLKDRNKKIFSRKSDFFIVRFSVNGLDLSRFGAIISKKVSKSAVKRNRIKRIIFDFVRINKLNEFGGKDTVITVLPPAVKLDKIEMEKELSRLLVF